MTTMYRISMVFTRETDHLSRVQYECAEAAGAAIADALGWPGFCFGAWHADPLDCASACCVFKSEGQRKEYEDARAAGKLGPAPRIVTAG
jgi:hypothetical protein